MKLTRSELRRLIMEVAAAEDGNIVNTTVRVYSNSNKSKRYIPSFSDFNFDYKLADDVKKIMESMNQSDGLDAVEER